MTPVSHLISQSPGDGILKKMSNMCYMCSIQHCIIPQIIFIGIKIGSGSYGLKLSVKSRGAVDCPGLNHTEGCR